MRSKESTALGKMLLDIIKDGIKSQKMKIDQTQITLLANLYFDALNRFNNSWVTKLFGFVGTSQFSLWKEGMLIATWLNSVCIVPVETN